MQPQVKRSDGKGSGHPHKGSKGTGGASSSTGGLGGGKFSQAIKAKSTGMKTVEDGE